MVMKVKSAWSNIIIQRFYQVKTVFDGLIGFFIHLVGKTFKMLHFQTQCELRLLGYFRNLHSVAGNHFPSNFELRCK